MDVDDRGTGLAASIAASAICAGVIGRPGCWSGLVMLPVTAQLMMTLSTALPFRLRLAAEDYARPPLCRQPRPPGDPALQEVEAPDHQAGGHRQAGGEPEPDPKPAEADAKAEPDRADHADQPVGDRREHHRPARVLEPAQGTRPITWPPSKIWNSAATARNVTAACTTIAIGRIGGIDEQADDALRHRPHHQRHRQHETAADDQRHGAGAQHARRIAAADREPDPHRGGLRQAKGHHEAHRGALQGDLMRRQLAVLITPIRKPDPANRPTSMIRVTPIGRPIRKISRKRDQSARQNRPRSSSGESAGRSG